MRVLHLNSEKSWRGGEQQVIYLIQELRKYKVFSLLACAKHSALAHSCQKQGILHVALPFWNELDIYTSYQIQKICRKCKIDLMHAHSPNAHSLALYSVWLGNTTPLVVSRRVDFPLKKKLLTSYKYNHPSIQKIICVSHKVKNVMEQYIHHAQKLTTIYSGVDLNRFTKSRKQKLRQEYKIPKDYFLIGNTSALSPQKDYDTFIRTAKKTISYHPKVHFLIIGEGKSRSEIENQILSEKMQDHISLTGFRNDIQDILPELDIFLFTSKDEALGTSILDAFAAEVPIVSTQAGGIPELISHRETGLLAPVGDSQTLAKNLLILLNSSRLRKSIIEQASQKLQNFSKEKTAYQNYLVYQKVLADL